MDFTKKRKKRIFYSLICITLLIIPYVTAIEPHPQNQKYTYSTTIANADSCNLTVITYPRGEIGIIGLEMEKSGFDFTSNISSGNFSQTGETCWDIICYDEDATPQYESGTKCLKINLSGTEQDTSSAIVNVLLIVFLITLMGGIFIGSRKISFDKWYNSILQKYETKNYVKLGLGSIGYNIMKNSFIIYYLLGLPILLLLTDIVYKFGIENMVDFMRVVLGVYIIGVIVVGMVFFSYVQEWIMMVYNQVKDMDWGIE